MVFNDTSTNAGIIQMIEQTTNKGLASISGVTSELNYFTNLINQFYRVASFYAWSVDKNWKFDDSNQSTFPQATTTIVDEQADYTMPSTTLRVRQVEILDSAGNYSTLQFMPEDSPLLLTEKDQEDPGIPSHYRLVDNSIILYPKPDTSVVTSANGLRVTIDREVDAFATTDTSQEPGFAKLFHPILYYGPSMEWAAVKGVPNVYQYCEKMLGQFPGFYEVMKKFFAERNQNVVPQLSRAYKSFK